MLRSILMFSLITLQTMAMALSPAALSDVSIIPKPVSVIPAKGTFTLTDKSAIFVTVESHEVKMIGQYLADKLNPATGLGIEVKTATGDQYAGNIYLYLSADATLGNEGYQLTINAEVVTLTANKPAGLFNGIQTIRQLFPSTIEMASKQQGPWELPAGTIRDYPEYAFRGVMLDVARHFFQVEDVKRSIDLMAAYKMNVMHLHLADDQGWRIEIKKWPKLTTIGGSTQVGGEKGGFSTLCTKKDITYQFIADVFGELATLTPGPYLHIGGDESHVTKLEDYIPFVNKVQDIVSKTGKQVIGWDEIALSTLKPNTSVQFWAKAENASKGVKQGAKVIMSPAANAYLDMQYDATTTLGLHWAGYVEVDKGYNWDPATFVPGIGKENILGIEAPMWSETITNMKEIEYMFFPRLPGYAEIGWSAPAGRSWDEYKVRLGSQGERFKAMQINYYPSKLVPWST